MMQQGRWLWLILLLLCALDVGAQDVTNVGAQTPYDQGRAISLSTYCNGADQSFDTACTNTWLAAGETARDPTFGVHLYIPAGTYLYDDDLSIANANNWHLRCEDPQTTVLKMNGQVSAFLNVTDVGGPHTDISIENCGWDIAGWDVNGQSFNFAHMIGFVDVGFITIRGNRFFDSVQPGKMCRMFPNCQRQYVVLIGCDHCLVEQNTLSEGGRIKVGRPGSHVLIQDNTLHNINDNAITVVDLGSNHSHDIIIQRNVIREPFGSGIFFGGDGQVSGDANQIHTDFTVRDNVILGGWKDNCIRGYLGNNASNIFIARNHCIRMGFSPAGGGGIAISRTNASVLASTNVTILENVMASVSPNIYDSEPIFIAGAPTTGLCILGNHTHNGTGGNAIRWQTASTSTGVQTGNDWHGMNTRIDAGWTIDESGTYGSCFVPTGESLGTGTWPTVAITAPTTSFSYSTATNPLTTVQGTASAGTTLVTWTCQPACGSGTASGTTNWTIPSLHLTHYVNHLLVTVTDVDDQTAAAWLVILYTPPDPQPMRQRAALTGG